MVPEPDMDTALKITWFTAGLFFLLFIVSAIGELLGWFDLIGLVGMSVGAFFSILLTFVGLLSGAGRRQVDGVLEAVLGNGEVLVSVDGRLEKLDKLDKLDVIEGAIAGEDGMVGQLDAVQFELDRQTGVLGEQLSVLSQIRDGMA